MDFMRDGHVIIPLFHREAGWRPQCQNMPYEHMSIPFGREADLSLWNGQLYSQHLPNYDVIAEADADVADYKQP